MGRINFRKKKCLIPIICTVNIEVVILLHDEHYIL